MISRDSSLRTIQRYFNGRSFGLSFLRRGWFKTPSELKIGTRRVPVSVLQEEGIQSDFIDIFINDCYGLRSLPARVETVVDIGANMGLFSMAARAFLPKAKIHAYEPNPQCMPNLRKNTTAVGGEVFGEAVGGVDGTIYLDLGAESNQVTVAANKEGTPAPQVGLATVVQRMGGAIDLAKIDCEGAEWDLVAEGDSFRKIKLVRMEYHIHKSRRHEDIKAALENLDFRIEQFEPSSQWGIVWARNAAAK